MHWKDLLPSLYYDGHVHTGVDGTIEMVGAGCGEGADGVLTVAVDLYILDLWRARLSSRFRRAVLPDPIGDDVRR